MGVNLRDIEYSGLNVLEIIIWSWIKDKIYGNDRSIEERTKDCVGVYDRKETGTYKRRRYAGDGRFMRHRTGQTSRGGLHGDIQ